MSIKAGGCVIVIEASDKIVGNKYVTKVRIRALPGNTISARANDKKKELLVTCKRSAENQLCMECKGEGHRKGETCIGCEGKGIIIQKN